MIGSNSAKVEKFKKEMKNVFEINVLRKMNYFLGMEVKQITSGIFISQKKYAVDIMKNL